MKTTRVKVLDQTLSLDETGTGDELLLFVHGWCCRRADWQQTLTQLSPQRHMIALDLPGHGDSRAASIPQWSVRGLADVVVAAVEQFGNGRRTTLIGHSMGGTVALEAARRLPQLAGVILVDTFVLPYGDIDEAQARDIETPYHQDFTTAVTDLVTGTAGAMDVATRTQLQQAMAASVERRDAMLALWANLLRWSPMAAFDELHLPITALNGDLIPAVARQRCAPFVREVLLPGAGHFPQLEMPAAFNAALAQVLADAA